MRRTGGACEEKLQRFRQNGACRQSYRPSERKNPGLHGPYGRDCQGRGEQQRHDPGQDPGLRAAGGAAEPAERAAQGVRLPHRPDPGRGRVLQGPGPQHRRLRCGAAQHPACCFTSDHHATSHLLQARLPGPFPALPWTSSTRSVIMSSQPLHSPRFQARHDLCADLLFLLMITKKGSHFHNRPVFIL